MQLRWLSMVFMAVVQCLVMAPSVQAQQWLTDRSLSGTQLPTPPDLPSVPSVVSYGEPPPPLAPEGAPSVFAPDVATFEAVPKTDSLVWFNPWSWIPKDGWSNSAELGINGSAGNAESFSFQTGTRFKRKTDFTLFDVRMTHNNTRANGLETQNNTLLYSDFERYLGKSPWSLFVKNGFESDKFKAFDFRYFINSGLGYNFYNTQDLKLTSRFGAGTSREFGGPDDRWVPEALFGADYEQIGRAHV